LQAKIHLETACGCARSFFLSFDKISEVPREYRVPIKATVIPWKAGRLTPMEVHSFRAFKMLRYELRSTRRIEVWYEEFING
jgi:hypothetical protein